MKTTLIAIALGIAATPALAALSGYNDSAVQIATIFESRELSDLVRQAPVDKIEFEGTTRDGLLEWEVDAGGCDVSVFLRAIPPAAADGAPVPGPTSYEVARIGRCD